MAYLPRPIFIIYVSYCYKVFQSISKTKVFVWSLKKPLTFRLAIWVVTLYHRKIPVVLPASQQRRKDNREQLVIAHEQ